VHCRTEVEAQEVRAAIAERWKECGLELHPEKTQVVYCKDEDRRRTIRTRSSIFWATRFGHGDRRIAKESTSSTSVPQFPTRR
jgi:RNA-directed DNA polymerase